MFIFSTFFQFIKDVIGSNEICCWSFYGHGKRIAEVCCTAIVYATDRKNTKVEFPEARYSRHSVNGPSVTGNITSGNRMFTVNSHFNFIEDPTNEC